MSTCSIGRKYRLGLCIASYDERWQYKHAISHLLYINSKLYIHLYNELSIPPLLLTCFIYTLSLFGKAFSGGLLNW